MKLSPVACSLALAFAALGAQSCGQAPSAAANMPETKAPKENKSGVAVLTPEAIRAKLDAAKGTVAVVNFWATWCPPCVKETPELIKFYDDHHGKGVTFLSLSVDHPSMIDKAVEPFVKEKGNPFPIYVVDERDPEVITDILGLELSGAVPTTWIVDPDGNPVRVWVEEITAKELEEAIAPLLPDH